MGLSVPRAVLARVHAHALTEHPAEAVGILAGDPHTRRARVYVPMRNETPDVRGYRVGGLALMAAEVALREAGHTVLAYVHSHPDAPAVPSDADRRQAFPGPSWVIVGVAQGRIVETTSWRQHEPQGALRPEPITVIPEDTAMATVHIPTPLRAFTEGQASVALEGATVGEVLGNLTASYAGLQKHLRDPEGKLRSFVNVYVGDEDIRYLQKEATPVGADTEITIVPSIAGGAR